MKLELSEKFKNLIKAVCCNFHAEFSDNTIPESDKIFNSWFEKYGRDFLIAKIKNDNIDINNIAKKLEDKSNFKIEKYYDKKGNASHYDSNRLNSIIKFERIYGTLATMTFCEITAERYRERIGKKDNQSLDQEVLKISWYENAAKYFYNKLGSIDEIIINNYSKEKLPWEK